MVKNIATIEQFAKQIYELLKSDRDVNIGVGGFTGEGKSTFSSKLLKSYSKATGVYWGFDRMTWSRKELIKWIDGDPKSKPNEKGLKKGQLPEYSAILPDELFKMFYRRTWFNEDQIDAIATFNMCRDRHLLLCGNIPNFWELDTGFTNRIRFYAYVPTRGVAWIFEQENNPFSEDNWNKTENKKRFRKHRNPYRITNFICEIHFNDWDKDEKIEYYNIRNQKRLSAITENKSEKIERYGAIKKQRDALIRMIMNQEIKCKKCGLINKTKLINQDIAEVIGISPEAVRLIRSGQR